MFFYFIPLGVSSVKKVHVWLTWGIVALLVYRALMTVFFPQMQIPIVSYFLRPVLTAEFVAASIQSLMTPNLWPAWAAGEHRVFCLIGFASVMIFWLLFGTSFEMKFGRPLFAGMIVLASMLAFAVCLVPVNSLNPTIWLGQIVTMFFAGLAFGMFAFEDVRFHYHLYILFFDHTISTYEIPAFVPLSILSVLMFIPMSTLWYEKGDIGAPIRLASINPLGWVAFVMVLGGIAGVLYRKFFIKREEEDF